MQGEIRRAHLWRGREGFVPTVLAGAKTWVVGDDTVLSALLTDIPMEPKR